MSSDELTPVQIERKLRGLVTELTQAQNALRDARDREVDLKHEFKAAYRRAILSAACPRVARDAATVAERDAWVDDQAAKEERAYDIAEAARRAAEDHLRTVRDQAMIVMSLGKSVTQAYGMAGVS